MERRQSLSSLRRPGSPRRVQKSASSPAISHTSSPSSQRSSSPFTHIEARFSTSPLRFQRSASANRIKASTHKAANKYRNRVMTDIHILENPRASMEEKRKATERIRALEQMDMTEKGGEQRNHQVLLFNNAAFTRESVRKNKDVNSKFYDYESEQRRQESPRSRIEREKSAFTSKMITPISPRRLRFSLGIDVSDQYKHVKSKYKDDLVSSPSSKTQQVWEQLKAHTARDARSPKNTFIRRNSGGVSPKSPSSPHRPRSPAIGKKIKSKKKASSLDYTKFISSPKKEPPTSPLAHSKDRSGPANGLHNSDKKVKGKDFDQCTADTEEPSRPIIVPTPSNTLKENRAISGATSNSLIDAEYAHLLLHFEPSPGSDSDTGFPLSPSQHEHRESSPIAAAASSSSPRTEITSARKPSRRFLTIKDESTMESQPPVKSPSPAKERPGSMYSPPMSPVAGEDNGKMRRFRRK